jgi:hypothetical protein
MRTTFCTSWIDDGQASGARWFFERLFTNLAPCCVRMHPMHETQKCRLPNLFREGKFNCLGTRTETNCVRFAFSDAETSSVCHLLPLRSPSSRSVLSPRFR